MDGKGRFKAQRKGHLLRTPGAGAIAAQPHINNAAAFRTTGQGKAIHQPSQIIVPRAGVPLASANPS